MQRWKEAYDKNVIFFGFHPDEDGHWVEWHEAATRIAALEADAKWLGELLAIIHRDGGHYQAQHGTEKAVNDAHLLWADLMTRAEARAARAPAPAPGGAVKSYYGEPISPTGDAADADLYTPAPPQFLSYEDGEFNGPAGDTP